MNKEEYPHAMRDNSQEAKKRRHINMPRINAKDAKKEEEDNAINEVTKKKLNQQMTMKKKWGVPNRN